MQTLRVVGVITSIFLIHLSPRILAICIPAMVVGNSSAPPIHASACLDHDLARLNLMVAVTNLMATVLVLIVLIAIVGNLAWFYVTLS